MAKEYRMIKLKKEQVCNRQKSVELACEQAISNNEKISYKLISEITTIPIKSLEREPYKGIINRFKNKSNIAVNVEVDSLKKEIVYLNSIIKKLREENRSLMTLLYEKGKV